MSGSDLTFHVKLAENDEERAAAFRLRYDVFVGEMGATPNAEMRARAEEFDSFDPFCEHLLLVEVSGSGSDALADVVGTIRLMTCDAARNGIGFYSQGEFDLSALLGADRRLLELSRACVAAKHRGGVAMHLLWNGVADIVAARSIDLLFGVASFWGTNPEPYHGSMAWLRRTHLAPAAIRPVAREGRRIELDARTGSTDERQALRSMPSLLRSYLRLGALIGDGAWIDREFNTIDVCVVIDVAQIAPRHRAHFERGREAQP